MYLTRYTAPRKVFVIELKVFDEKAGLTVVSLVFRSAFRGKRIVVVSRCRETEGGMRTSE